MHDGRTVAIAGHGLRSGPDSATFIEIAFVSVTSYFFWPNFNSLLGVTIRAMDRIARAIVLGMARRTA